MAACHSVDPVGYASGWTPAAVAAGVAALIFVGGLTSGGSFSPARQLGPSLFAERFSYLWAYMLGPIAGAVLLVVLARAAGLPLTLTCSLCGAPPRRGTDTCHAPGRRLTRRVAASPDPSGDHRGGTTII